MMFSTIPFGDLQRSAEHLLADEAAHLRGMASGAEIETRLSACQSPSHWDSAAGATLVVVGSRGVGRVVGLLLGSVSQAIATRASCPVLVVPPKTGKHS
jgi:nucleotide-binding universal stress UspA family protein